MSLSVAPTRVALRVVVVDDRAERRALILLALRGPDADAVHVSEAEDGAAAMQMIESDGADIVLIEVQIQGALALIGSLRGRYPELVIVVCSFRTGSMIERLALDAGADSYIHKPVRREDLLQLAAERMTAR